MKCHYCEKTEDLRPYGPDFAMVCFGCATATPEREHYSSMVYRVQMEMIKGPVVIGNEAGPVPFAGEFMQ